MKQGAALFNRKHYLTDGGLETSLIYHQHIPRKHFAAFELLTNDKGREGLEKYYRPYLKLAERHNLPLVVAVEHHL